jgi:hypothetical protein
MAITLKAGDRFVHRNPPLKNRFWNGSWGLIEMDECFVYSIDKGVVWYRQCYRYWFIRLGDDRMSLNWGYGKAHRFSLAKAEHYVARVLSQGEHGSPALTTEGICVPAEALEKP